jgi:cardiolipin synthase
MKRLINFLVKKPISVSILILLQLGLIYMLIYLLSVRLTEFLFIVQVLNMMIVIYILNKNDNPSYKMTWIIFILGIPLVGGITYLMFGGRKVPRDIRTGIKELNNGQAILIQEKTVMDSIHEKEYLRQARYLYDNTGFPIYKNTKVTYLSSGEAKFEALVNALKSAEKFILLEYFIIKEGYVWSTIKEILVSKVKEGVDVKLIYDDAGSKSLPYEFLEDCRALGIKAFAFNPLRPILAIYMNNRDHRKIAVVDGRIGFIGGMNLADEYINRISPFGHWKDVAVQFEGEAVYSLSLMFLQFYDHVSKEISDYSWYYGNPKKYENVGYVQNFSDSPTDEEPVSQFTHLNLINSASSYIYIMTPYLVIGYEIMIALVNAAKSGVDVRIMVPHIPDKKYVFSVTRSNYEYLTQNGVRIYEYLPGFLHAKVMVADDRVAIVGTTNLDFRSYFLHFECGSLIIDDPSIKDIVDDCKDTLSKCIEITYEESKNVNFMVKLWRAILNMFSTLL